MRIGTAKLQFRTILNLLLLLLTHHHVTKCTNLNNDNKIIRNRTFEMLRHPETSHAVRSPIRLLLAHGQSSWLLPSGLTFLPREHYWESLIQIGLICQIAKPRVYRLAYQQRAWASRDTEVGPRAVPRWLCLRSIATLSRWIIKFHVLLSSVARKSLVGRASNAGRSWASASSAPNPGPIFT